MASARLREAGPQRAGLAPAGLARLRQEVAGTVEGERPWCAGAVLFAGRGPWLAVRQAVGSAVRYSAYDPKADRGVELPVAERLPTTVRTAFDLASLTKLFTAVAAVQQMERGRLAPDAPVARYVEEFGAAGKETITVRQLLQHTSGLRSGLPFYAQPAGDDPLAALWAESPLQPPGTGYRYSDLNLIALQQVLERITGRPLDRLIQEGVTGPLDMVDTRFGPLPESALAAGVAATEDQRLPWAKCDRGLLHGVVHDENAAALGGVAGHAGLFSTGFDLAVFCRTLLAGGAYGTARILAPESVRLLLGWPGLGFAVDEPYFMGELSGRGAAGHTGFTGTSLVLDRATDTFLVLLANAVHPVRRPMDNRPRAAAATWLARSVR